MIYLGSYLRRRPAVLEGGGGQIQPVMAGALFRWWPPIFQMLPQPMYNTQLCVIINHDTYLNPVRKK